jgi:membrane dipeptidase
MLKRRDFLLSAGSVAMAAALATPCVQAASKFSVRRYAGSVIVDGLGSLSGLDANADAAFASRTIADVKSSGVTALNLTVGGVGNGPQMYLDSIQGVADAEGLIAAHPDVFIAVRTARDIQTAKTTGRLGLIYGFQDTSMLDGELARVSLFQNLGVRIVQLTYNRRNIAGDGCLESADGGLSSFGRELIDELNRLKLLLDLSHAAPRTIAEGIAACKTPLAITHTGCRALVDVPRNTSDRELRALAEKGGVAGIYFMPFLRASGQPRAEDLIRHLEHAVSVCGEDHVGLGTDGVISGQKLDAAAAQSQREFVEKRRKAGIAAPGEDPEVFNVIPEYNDPRRFVSLADDLSRRGWSDRRIEKILGGNFVRLFADVWGA